MNAASARKIAVDIPSGLNADTGRAHGVVFRADVTATMGACKLGLFVDADAPVGRVEVVELGVPILVDGRGAGAGGAGVRTHLLDAPWHRGDAAAAARLRAQGQRGHLLVVAGSPGKTGAAVLVGQSALRSGAGLVTIASTAPGQAALDAKVVELMTARYAKGAEVDGDEAVAALTKLAERSQAIAIGPGHPDWRWHAHGRAAPGGGGGAADGAGRGRAERAGYRRADGARGRARAARADAAPGRDGPAHRDCPRRTSRLIAWASPAAWRPRHARSSCSRARAR